METIRFCIIAKKNKKKKRILKNVHNSELYLSRCVLLQKKKFEKKIVFIGLHCYVFNRRIDSFLISKLSFSLEKRVDFPACETTLTFLTGLRVQHRVAFSLLSGGRVFKPDASETSPRFLRRLRGNRPTPPPISLT